MSLLTENVIPGNHGRIFGTNATTDKDIERIKAAIEKVDGVKDVVLVKEVFPRELIVHTTKLVSVAAIENEVKKTGLHCIPKGIFPVLEKED